MASEWMCCGSVKASISLLQLVILKSLVSRRHKLFLLAPSFPLRQNLTSAAAEQESNILCWSKGGHTFVVERWPFMFQHCPDRDKKNKTKQNLAIHFLYSSFPDGLLARWEDIQMVPADSFKSSLKVMFLIKTILLFLSGKWLSTRLSSMELL